MQLATKHVDAQDAKEEKEEAKEHGHVAQLCARGRTISTQWSGGTSMTTLVQAMTRAAQQQLRVRKASRHQHRQQLASRAWRLHQRARHHSARRASARELQASCQPPAGGAYPLQRLKAEERVDKRLERRQAVDSPQRTQHAHGAKPRVVARGGQEVGRPRTRDDSCIQQVPRIFDVLAAAQRGDLDGHLDSEDAVEYQLHFCNYHRLVTGLIRVQRAVGHHHDRVAADDYQDEGVEAPPLD